MPPAATSRRRASALPADERRAAIVEATAPLLLEHGESVTSRQIAAAAGIGPLQPEAPPAWTLYFASDDADAHTATTKAAGGSVLSEPMDVADLGLGVSISVPWPPDPQAGVQAPPTAGAPQTTGTPPVGTEPGPHPVPALDPTGATA